MTIRKCSRDVTLGVQALLYEQIDGRGKPIEKSREESPHKKKMKGRRVLIWGKDRLDLVNDGRKKDKDKRNIRRENELTRE